MQAQLVLAGGASGFRGLQAVVPGPSFLPPRFFSSAKLEEELTDVFLLPLSLPL